MGGPRRWLQHLGLRYQVALGVGVGTLIIFGGFSYLTVAPIRESQAMAGAERLRLAQVTATSIDAFITHTLHQLVRVTQEEAFRSATSLGERTAVLTDVYHVLGEYDALSLLDGEGRELWSYPSPLEAHEQGLDSLYASVDKALETGYPTVAQVNTTASANRHLAALVVPFAQGGEVAGALVAQLKLEYENIQLVSLPGGSPTLAVAIIDQRGTILDWSGPVDTEHVEVVSGEPVKVEEHYTLLRPLIKAREPGVAVHHKKREEGGGHLVAYAPLTNIQGGVIVEEQKDLALAIPQQLRRTLPLFGTLALVVAAVGAWLHARYVTRPIERLEQATRRIAEGTLEEPVAVARGDEVGMLAQSFDTMRLQLKLAQEQRDRWEEQLEARVRERTERVHQLLAKTITAQEDERMRLARELHDESSQSLGALSVSLDRLGKLLGQASPQAQAEIEQARNMARSLLQETRRLIYDLRPSVLDDMGLEAAIRWSAETHLQRHGVEVTIQNSLTPGRLPAPVEVALFRVAQEAIINIGRHAHARHAGIVLEQEDSSLRMQVWDDGQGFDPNRVGNGPEDSGVGLEGMWERVHLIGGRMEVLSTPGEGTVIKVEVTLDEGAVR